MKRAVGKKSKLTQKFVHSTARRMEFPFTEIKKFINRKNLKRISKTSV